MSDTHLLLQEHIPQLFRYAVALTRDSERATDLVEDAAMEALRRGHKGRGGADFRIWLLSVLHELHDNPFRRAGPVGETPIASNDTELTLSDLDRALGAIPEEQRAVILLVGLEGLSYAQTAGVLGVSVGAMRARLARGREGLRRALGVDAPGEVADAA